MDKRGQANQRGDRLEMNDDAKVNSNLSKVIEEILAADAQSHCIVIYKDLLSFREIYT